jgi:Tfp pilus assembly protein PilN
MLNINLIASRRADRQRRLKMMRCSVYGLLTMATAIVVMFAWMTVAMRLTQNEIEECEARLNAPEFVTAIERVNFLKQEIASLEPRLSLLEKVHSSEQDWLDVLDHTSAVIPADVWLTEVSSKRDKNIQTLTLRGTALSHHAAGNLMLNLKHADWCGAPQLSFTELSEARTGQEVVNFEILAPLARAIGSDLT